MFVDDEVVIDGPFNENCIMQFETQGDRILAFSVVDGNIKDALQLLNVKYNCNKVHKSLLINVYFNIMQIQDGFGIDSPMLKVENQIVHEVSRQNAPAVLYTKISEASVQFTKMPADSNFQLKISKVFSKINSSKMIEFIVNMLLIRIFQMTCICILLGCRLSAWNRRQHPMWSSG
jgi:C-type lectin domain family 10 protein A